MKASPSPGDDSSDDSDDELELVDGTKENEPAFSDDSDSNIQQQKPTVARRKAIIVSSDGE